MASPQSCQLLFTKRVWLSSASSWAWQGRVGWGGKQRAGQEAWERLCWLTIRRAKQHSSTANRSCSTAPPHPTHLLVWSELPAKKALEVAAQVRLASSLGDDWHTALHVPAQQHLRRQRQETQQISHGR